MATVKGAIKNYRLLAAIVVAGAIIAAIVGYAGNLNVIAPFSGYSQITQADKSVSKPDQRIGPCVGDGGDILINAYIIPASEPVLLTDFIRENSTS